jgi:hypothetical protein
MPREEEMLPKDKYTLFDKKEKSYRKSIHSMLYSHIYMFKPIGILLLRGSAELTAFFTFRAPQVDSCQPTCQPSRFLNGFFSPAHVLYIRNSTLAGDLSERKTTYGQPEFWLFGICSAATLKRMVAYNVP